jgi:hypothetical protein
MRHRWRLGVGKSRQDFAFNEKQDLFLSAGWTVRGAAGNWLIVFELDLGNVPRKERFIDSKRKADGQHREPKEPAGQQSLKNPHGFAGLLVIRKDKRCPQRDQNSKPEWSGPY